MPYTHQVYTITSYGINLTQYHNPTYTPVLEYLINSIDDLTAEINSHSCQYDYNQSPIHGTYIYVNPHPESPAKANQQLTNFIQKLLQQIQIQDDVYYLEQPLTNQDISILTNDIHTFINAHAQTFKQTIMN